MERAGGDVSVEVIEEFARLDELATFESRLPDLESKMKDVWAIMRGASPTSRSARIQEYATLTREKANILDALRSAESSAKRPAPDSADGFVFKAPKPNAESSPGGSSVITAANESTAVSRGPRLPRLHPKNDDRQADAASRGHARVPISERTLSPGGKNIVKTLEADSEARRAGKAFPAGARAIGPDGCKHCPQRLVLIMEKLKPAERTVAELKRAKMKGKYNMARAREILVGCAFESGGNYIVHRDCLIAATGLSQHVITTAHHAAIRASGAPLVKKSKTYVVKNNLLDRVVVPEIFPGSRAAYMKSLSDGDLVEITQWKIGAHGLSDRPGNKTMIAQRQHFKSFVQSNRASTGRTKDRTGRYHGAVYTLDPRIETIKHDPKKPRSSALTTSFQDQLKASFPELKVPSETAIRLWFNEFYGQHDDEHTVIAPHKTDYCGVCAYVKNELASAKKTLERHRQQHDQGELTRQLAIKEVEDDITALQDKLDEHKVAADRACKAYKERVAGAHDAYRTLSDAWERWMRAPASRRVVGWRHRRPRRPLLQLARDRRPRRLRRGGRARPWVARAPQSGQQMIFYLPKKFDFLVFRK